MESNRPRVESFFRLLSMHCLTIRRLKMIEVFPLTPQSSSRFMLINPAEKIEPIEKFRPIIKYLAFGRKYLEYMFTEPIPLRENEIFKIDLLKRRFKIYKTSEDFHVESLLKISVPNRIIDLLLLGTPHMVQKEYLCITQERKILRRKLVRRLLAIKQFFNNQSHPRIFFVAYRGELSYRGRFPGDDIDLLIICRKESDYSCIMEDILTIAKRLQFQEVNWIEANPSEITQTKSTIFYSPKGMFRLDCYVSVWGIELSRVKHQSSVEALWEYGVWSHSKPIYNDHLFKNFVYSHYQELRKTNL